MEPIIHLQEEDVSYTYPERPLLEDIALRLIREGNTSKPGYVFIQNIKSIFHTKRKAEKFQFNLMQSLHDYFSENYPEVLTPHFMDEKHPDADKIHDQSTLFIEPLVVDGLDSAKMLHLDSLKRLFVSIMYGPFSNISGGNPRLFDALKYVQESGKEFRHVYHYVHEKEYSSTSVVLGYHPDEFFTLLPKQKDAAYRKYLTTFTDLDYSQYPLLIFSNRPDDGIMHGATNVRKKDTRKRSRRSVSYVALSYKIPPHFLK